MIRLLAKLYIQRYLDYHVSVPGWVKRRLKWDMALARYFDQLVDVQDKLHAQSPVWLNGQSQSELQQYDYVTRRVSLSAVTSVAPSDEVRFRRRKYALACLSFVLISTSVLFLTERSLKESKYEVGHLPNDKFTAQPQDDKLVELAFTGASKFIRQAELLGWSHQNDANLVENMILRVQEIFPAKRWNKKSIVSLRNCVEMAGRSSGQFLNQVGSGLQGSESVISQRIQGSVSSVRQNWKGWSQSLSKSLINNP
jgi:hypothetical protein